MPSFVVHQHTHAGWYKHTHEAADANAAMYADLLRNHPWLRKYGHKAVFEEGRYVIQYNGEPFPPCYQGEKDFMFPNWFGDRIHIGEPDDCAKCGGTGVNHYNPFRQCWECGDQELRGTSTGKIKTEAAP